MSRRSILPPRSLTICLPEPTNAVDCDHRRRLHAIDQGFARNNLAILEKYKADLPYVGRVEVEQPSMLIREGIVSPQGDLAGEARQIEITPPGPSCGDYLKVLSIEPLPPGN
jgi:hypothetical protein